MLKYTIALVLAFTIGAACRWFSLPAPAPPMLQGAFLVLAMTLGFASVDKLLASQAAATTPPPVTTTTPGGTGTSTAPALPSSQPPLN